MNAARATFLVALLFASTAQAITIGSITLTDLGAGVVPNALNNVGQVVGQDASGQAFMWQAGNFTPLGTLGGSQSAANDINDNGWVVGWANRLDGKKSAFRWTSSGGILDINVGLNIESAVEAINDQGDAVGWMQSGNQYRSFLLGNDDGKGTLFGSANTQAFGINANREVVGVTRNSLGEIAEGIYWDGISSSSNWNLGFYSYHPLAGINDSGLSAGEDSGYAGYWQKGGAVNGITKVDPADPSSLVCGLNDQSLLVGQSGNKAFFYDQPNHNLYNLNSFLPTNSPFSQLTVAQDINNTGMFVGIGLINGIQHGFIGQISSIPVSNWKITGSGSFTLHENWSNNIVPNEVDATANFLGNIINPSTITLDSPATLGTINFDSIQSYTIAGTGSITLQVSSGEASINVLNGSHEISVPVDLGSDTVISGNLTCTSITGNHALTVLGNLTATSIDVDTLTIGSMGALVAVPEPSVFALLLTFGIGIWCLRKGANR